MTLPVNPVGVPIPQIGTVCSVLGTELTATVTSVDRYDGDTRFGCTVLASNGRSQFVIVYTEDNGATWIAKQFYTPTVYRDRDGVEKNM